MKLIAVFPDGMTQEYLDALPKGKGYNYCTEKSGRTYLYEYVSIEAFHRKKTGSNVDIGNPDASRLRR